MSTAVKIVQVSLLMELGSGAGFQFLPLASVLTALFRCPQKIMTYIYSFKHKTKQKPTPLQEVPTLRLLSSSAEVCLEKKQNRIYLQCTGRLSMRVTVR